MKVGGERAYAKARRGESVETRTRAGHGLPRSTCSRATATARGFEIECSAGTYVRPLIADLGDAYCEELERTAIGPFRLDRGRRGELIVRSRRRWRFLPERLLTEDEARVGIARRGRARAVHGRQPQG